MLTYFALIIVLTMDKANRGEVKKPRQIFFCPPCNMQFTTRKLFGIHQKKPSHIRKEKSQPKPKNHDLNGRLGIYVKG